MKIAAVFALLLAACALPPVKAPVVQAPPPAPEAHPFPTAVRLTVNGFFQCSGTQLSPGFVITAAHCISPGLGVEGHAATSVTYPWPDADIAVVMVPSLPTGVNAVLAQEPTRPGDLLSLSGWGCEHGSALRTREGRFITYGWPTSDGIISALVCPGDSGGAILNERGELVGVISALLKFGDLSQLALGAMVNGGAP